MTKQFRSKRVVAIIIVLVIALSLSSQAYAAPWDTAVGTTPGGGRPNSYFTWMSGTMNALNGGNSTSWGYNSGTLPSNSRVTAVTVTQLRVSSGSAPLYLYIQSPQGTIGVMGPYGVGTFMNINFTPFFVGENPSGRWTMWIRTTGLVSTATANARVDYFYP